MNEIFIDIIEFKSEFDFKSYKYRKEKFDFVVDPTNAINSYKQNNEAGKKSVETLEQSLQSLRASITARFVTELKNKIQEVEIEIANLHEEWDELIKQNSCLDERQAKTIAKRDEHLNESKIEIEKKKNDKRFKIMREKKGLYNFDWKHERKSWQGAYCKIFFDIGESYLFEKIEDVVFKKTEIGEFLERHLHAK